MVEVTVELKPMFNAPLSEAERKRVQIKRAKVVKRLPNQVPLLPLLHLNRLRRLRRQRHLVRPKRKRRRSNPLQQTKSNLLQQRGNRHDAYADANNDADKPR